MWSRKLLVLGLGLALAALPVLVPWSKIVLTVALSKGLAVLGILVLLRAGQVSFGQAMFFAASAYAAAFVARGFPGSDIVTLFIVGGLTSAVLGLLVGLFVTRYRQVFFGMLNLAFSMVLFAILERSYHYTGGSDGLSVPRSTFFGFALERQQYEYAFFYFMIALALLITIAVHRFLQAPLGQALNAVKTNETRLEYLGVSPRRVLLAGYVVAAVLAGLGGTAMAIIQGFVSPQFGYWFRSGEFIFIAVLGGAGHVGGAFAGALTYEVIRSYLAATVGGAWQLFLGAILLMIILVAPEGLAGFLKVRKKREKVSKEEGVGVDGALS